MSKLVIFGTGKIGQVAYHHFAGDSDYEVAGFTTDRAYIPAGGKCEGLPVVAFEDVEQHFAPKGHAMFVAVGYQHMNALRAERVGQAHAKGYASATYISSDNRLLKREQVGENCFIMSGEPVQPHARIGHNCFIWTNALIGHHSTVGDHCWITSGATIGGNTTIGSQCFIGLNATIGHELSVGSRSLIGAGALILKDAPEESVYIAAETPKFRLSSEQFLKMATLK